MDKKLDRNKMNRKIRNNAIPGSAAAVIEACYYMADELNTARNSGDYINIAYEHSDKLTDEAVEKGWDHVYRRLYKKARRYLLNVDERFKI